jgi:LmbE family N-acetylglucosaminyl deacetylase
MSDAVAVTTWPDPETLPLLPPAAALAFGPTLVVAPHPDDESLGCGGALALLRRAGTPVHVLFLSDGTGSHPASRRYPPPELAALRQAEALAALAILGVPAMAAGFLRLPDRHVPRAGGAGFLEARERFRAYFGTLDPAPRTILLPWRRDPHTDHRAAWELLDSALAGSDSVPRRVEYPIWLWDLGQPGDQPGPAEVSGWRLDIRDVLPIKLAAIAAHRSQTTTLIDDDPVGWTIPPATIRRFSQPWEVFLEDAR